MIRITLRGDPGHRTGTAEIDGQTWQLATWHRQSGGEIHATTDQGKRVALATDAGKGGIAIDREHWSISNARWDGYTFTGETVAYLPTLTAATPCTLS